MVETARVQTVLDDVGEAPELHIRASKPWPGPNFRELWTTREVLFYLAWRDIKVRYKQAALGVAWVVLQPLLLMLIFTFTIGRVASVTANTEPYAVYVLAGLAPWTLFASSLTLAGNSLVENQALVTKVYFPRMALPLAALLAALVDFALAFVLLVVVAAISGVYPSWRLLAVVPLTLLVVVSSLALSLWLSAINVRFRDVRHTLPFIVQLGFFVTPIFYAASIVPDSVRWIYDLNPMVGAIDGFRWAVMGTGSVSSEILISIAIVIVVLAGGLFYFRRVERTFADIV